MTILRHLYNGLAFSAILLATNCSFDSSEPEDTMAAADSGNQVVEVKKEDIPDSEIPNPEQVAADAAKAAEGTGDSIDSNSASPVQELSADQQVAQQGPQLPENPGAEESEYQLAKDKKATEPVADAEAAPPSTDMLPSLSQVVAESDTEDHSVTPPTKGKKAKHQRAPKAVASVGETGSSTEADSGTSDKASKPKGRLSHKGQAVSGKHYIVQPGDTLGRISSTIYGSPEHWQDLAAANGLKSDSRIYPGDIIRYRSNADSAEFERKFSSLARSKIIVQKADTLESIAVRNFGDKAYWKLLWRWNVASIREPNKIFEGQSLQFIAPQELATLLSKSKGLESAH